MNLNIQFRRVVLSASFTSREKLRNHLCNLVLKHAGHNSFHLVWFTITYNNSSFFKSLATRFEHITSVYYQARSSRPEVFCKKDILRNFTKFTGKRLRQSLFFNKVAGLRPATLLKKSLWHRCFPVNFAKFLRTPFLTERRRQLLLSSHFTY